MTTTASVTISRPFLKASWAVVNGVLTVRLSGTADERVAKELNALLTRVHQEALRSHATSVLVDFRELEFMNSSCFKGFVTWISRVRGLRSELQYRIRFVSDVTKHWQRRSLAALSCFAIDLVHMEA